jgi:hypothetical protein
MAKEYKEYGIKVNALQINGAKMSKDTLQKVTPRWRLIGKIQNLFFPPPEKIAEIYYHICISEEFKTITGKLINDKKEVMTSSAESPSLLMQLKQVVGNRYYPRYAAQKENQDKIWHLCLDITKDKTA